VDSPWITLPLGGDTVKVNPDGGTMESVAVEVALCVPTVTVIGPLAAPVGMTNEMAVAEKLATGAATVPPPCWFRVTVGLNPPPGAKFVPVIVMRFPTDADWGLKPLMTGTGMIVAVVVAVAVPPRMSVTVKLTVKVPPEEYVYVGFSPDPVPPSPKFHANVRGVPSGVLELEPLKVMGWPGWPV
jgi:hypothetical protein